MKFKWILILVFFVMVSLLLGGYTAAIFTDRTHSADNFFSTGVVNINSYRGGFDTVSGPMFYFSAEDGQTVGTPTYSGVKPTSYWIPGTSYTRSLIVYNKSSSEVILKQVSAETVSGDEMLASQMNVGIYCVYPQENQTALFMSLKGDETGPNEIVDYFTRTLNQAVLRNPTGQFPSYIGISQGEIEGMVDQGAGLLWTGSLQELCAGFQNFNHPVVLDRSGIADSCGCILAFQISMNTNAGNEFQDLSASFQFQIEAQPFYR